MEKEMRMHSEGSRSENAWISLILRVAAASLFGVAAIGKFQGSLDQVVINFQNTFKNTWLPINLVTLHARLVPYIEAILPVWLLTGWRLKWAWILAAFFTVSLAFGMMVAQQSGVAASNYFYVLLCCAGLHFSQFDHFKIGRCCKNNSHEQAGRR